MSDNRHVKLPRVGFVRAHENMRRLTRLMGRGLARILAATTVKRGVLRLFIAFQVEVQVWSCKVPASLFGTDLNFRDVVATAADSE